MAAQPFAADTAFVIRLRSYGFFHSGRERLQTRVLKRTWEFVPGNTLYGALSAALIRLDGLDEAAEPYEEGPGDYHHLLAAIKKHRIRFTPLLPVCASKPIQTAKEYCIQTSRLHAAVYADHTKHAPTESESAMLHTTPHAPLDRHTEQIHSDQLFALRTHRPVLDYDGFIFATAAERPLLERALRYLPFVPVGGRGKFTLMEGEIKNAVALNVFRDELVTWLSGLPDPWLRLLTPMVLRDGNADTPLLGTGRNIEVDRLRRYRVWRTGRYYDAVKGDFATPMGVEREVWEKEDEPPLPPGGRESAAVSAVPERSRFKVLPNDDVAKWFIEGAGHPSWTYLGWGQVVIE